MRIKERRLGPVVVLDFVGAIAGRRAPAVIDEVVSRHMREGHSILVANLNRVPRIDLAGLSALVDAYCTTRQSGSVLRLACLTNRLHDLLVITRLLTVFETFDSVEEAAGEATSAARPGASDAAELPVSSLGTIQRFLRRA